MPHKHSPLKPNAFHGFRVQTIGHKSSLVHLNVHRHRKLFFKQSLLSASVCLFGGGHVTPYQSKTLRMAVVLWSDIISILHSCKWCSWIYFNIFNSLTSLARALLSTLPLSLSSSERIKVQWTFVVLQLDKKGDIDVCLEVSLFTNI